MFCYVKKTPEVCPVLGENVTCANRSPILVFHCLTQNERKKLRKKRTLQKKERQTRTERQKRKQMKETTPRRQSKDKAFRLLNSYTYSTVAAGPYDFGCTHFYMTQRSWKRGQTHRGSDTVYTSPVCCRLHRWNNAGHGSPGTVHLEIRLQKLQGWRSSSVGT